MQSYETTATVEGEGQVRVSGVPFAAGTQVEVSIYPQRRSAAEFAAAWQSLCQNLRDRPDAGEWSEAEIEQEIRDYRAGR
jgi:hypothetical protein